MGVPLNRNVKGVLTKIDRHEQSSQIVSVINSGTLEHNNDC